MAKFLVDEAVAEEVIKKYGSGDLTRALMRDIFSQSKEVVYCEECDMAYPCFSPFDRKDYVRCTYLTTGNGKVVCRNHFCKAGERRQDDACER